MEELIDLYDGPAIPVLTNKEKEERRGGAAAMPFLGRTTGVAMNGGARLAMTNGVRWSLEGRQGLLGLLRALSSRLTAGETAAAAAAALTALALGVLALSVHMSRSDWGAYRAPSWSVERSQDPANGFGAADKLPQAERRPMVGDLIGHETEADSLPAEAPKADAPHDADTVDAPAPAPTEPPPAPAPVTPAAALPPTAPRLLSSSFGFGNGPRAADEGLRDSLAPFNGIRSIGGLPPMREFAARRVSPPERTPRAQRSRAVKNLNATAHRAMGQLKFADRESFAALGASGSDRPRQFATDAFEQNAAIGGASPIGGGGMSSGGVMGPIGSGAPDLTQPSIGPTENKTPYQNQVDDAKQGIDKAMALTLLGLALLAAGAAAMSAGKQMMASPAPPTQATGAKLMMLGEVLLVAGSVAVAAGLMMKKDAQDNGDRVAQDSGQKAQGNVINRCAVQAVMPQSCNPPSVEQPGNNVHQSVVAESMAGSDLQRGGRPINN